MQDFKTRTRVTREEQEYSKRQHASEGRQSLPHTAPIDGTVLPTCRASHAAREKGAEGGTTPTIGPAHCTVHAMRGFPAAGPSQPATTAACAMDQHKTLTATAREAMRADRESMAGIREVLAAGGRRRRADDRQSAGLLLSCPARCLLTSPPLQVTNARPGASVDDWAQGLCWTVPCP